MGPKPEAVYKIEKYPGLNWAVLGIAKFSRTGMFLDNRGDMRWTKDGGVNKKVLSHLNLQKSSRGMSSSERSELSKSALG